MEEYIPESIVYNLPDKHPMSPLRHNHIIYDRVRLWFRKKLGLPINSLMSFLGAVQNNVQYNNTQQYNTVPF